MAFKYKMAELWWCTPSRKRDGLPGPGMEWSENEVSYSRERLRKHYSRTDTGKWWRSLTHQLRKASCQLEPRESDRLTARSWSGIRNFKPFATWWKTGKFILPFSQITEKELTNSSFDFNSFRILGIVTKSSCVHCSDPENVALTSGQSMTSESKEETAFRAFWGGRGKWPAA